MKPDTLVKQAKLDVNQMHRSDQLLWGLSFRLSERFTQ